MKLCIGFPMFNEEENVEALLGQISAQEVRFRQLGYDELAILAVDNGSTDRTLQRLREGQKVHPSLRILSMARNFPYESAVTAILDHSDGDVTVLMDGDLQDPPTLVPSLLEKLAEGFDVVYGVRVERDETALRRALYPFFYRVWSALSSVSVPMDAGNFGAMRRPVVTAICGMRERHRFLRGLRTWVGFRQAGVPYRRPIRHAGTTKFPIRKAIALASDGILAFSILPIRLFLFAGGLTMIAAIGLAVYLLGAKIAVELGWVDVGAFPTGLVQSNLLTIFFAAVNLMGLGVIGEYVGRIYEEVKSRPVYVLRSDSGIRAETKGA